MSSARPFVQAFRRASPAGAPAASPRGHMHMHTRICVCICVCICACADARTVLARGEFDDADEPIGKRLRRELYRDDWAYGEEQAPARLCARRDDAASAV